MKPTRKFTSREKIYLLKIYNNLYISHNNSRCNMTAYVMSILDDIIRKGEYGYWERDFLNSLKVIYNAQMIFIENSTSENRIKILSAIENVYYGNLPF